MTERHLPHWKVLANIGEASCTSADVALRITYVLLLPCLNFTQCHVTQC